MLHLSSRQKGRNRYVWRTNALRVAEMSMQKDFPGYFRCKEGLLQISVTGFVYYQFDFKGIVSLKVDRIVMFLRLLYLIRCMV